MSHILDRPVWNALNTRHAALSQGNGMARRYAPDDPSLREQPRREPRKPARLAEIAAPGETLIFLQADEFVLPPGFAATMTAFGVQMVADRRMPLIDDDGSSRSARRTQPTCSNWRR